MAINASNILSTASQNTIAACAFGLFLRYWNNPYRPRVGSQRDSQWLAQLANGQQINLQQLDNFLADYSIARSVHGVHRTIVVNAFNQLVANLTPPALPPDPSPLIALWSPHLQQRRRMLACASALLYFAYPNVSYVMMNQNIYKAVNYRMRIAVLPNPPSAQAIHNIMQKLIVNPPSAQAILKTNQGLINQHSAIWNTLLTQNPPLNPPNPPNINFLLRRIADKHLWLEGAIL